MTAGEKPLNLLLPSLYLYFPVTSSGLGEAGGAWGSRSVRGLPSVCRAPSTEVTGGLRDLRRPRLGEGWTGGPRVAAQIGICYGQVANNLPPPSIAVKILKDNKIPNVRLFNTEPTTLASFSGSGINLTIGVRNEDLHDLASGNTGTSLRWLQSNIFQHVPPKQVQYIAVGNEVFLKDPYYTPYVVPAILNLFQALGVLGLSGNIKLSSPLAASVLLDTYPPSSARFDPDLLSYVKPLLQFLHDTGSPFMVNVYPYISYTNNAKFISLDYALFRGGSALRDGDLTYTNLFDASIDAFSFAMEKEGFPGLEMVVAETGWPTGGGDAAGTYNALVYNGNLVRRVVDNVGTPKRPGTGLKVFLFGLFDEDEKDGPEYERHFGIFRADGAKAYDLIFW
ncbi:hypothetical protein CDL15_Pgr024396 [Punica granatum]|uniref:glucan endo-1,3-beta-D-glucosidase n=2 Tax=Punica granatum TaxID=22663 RepID=A0A218XXZ4_PUNGR|nr:hypothetical protein CDL15_Pgr024396 [Punica granatum]